MGAIIAVVGWIGRNPKIASALFIAVALALAALWIDRNAVHRTENNQLLEKVETNNKVQNEKDRLRSMPRNLRLSIDELRRHKF